MLRRWPGMFSGIDGGVLYRRDAAGADPGICVRGLPFPSPSPPFPPLPFPFPLHSPSPPFLYIPLACPLNQLGERCKLRQRIRGRKQNLAHSKAARKPLVAIVFSILKSVFYEIRPRLRGWQGVAVCWGGVRSLSSHPLRTSPALILVCVCAWLLGNTQETEGLFMHGGATFCSFFHVINNSVNVCKQYAKWWCQLTFEIVVFNQLWLRLIGCFF